MTEAEMKKLLKVEPHSYYRVLVTVERVEVDEDDEREYTQLDQRVQSVEVSSLDAYDNYWNLKIQKEKEKS